MIENSSATLTKVASVIAIVFAVLNFALKLWKTPKKLKDKVLAIKVLTDVVANVLLVVAIFLATQPLMGAWVLVLAFSAMVMESALYLMEPAISKLKTIGMVWFFCLGMNAITWSIASTHLNFTKNLSDHTITIAKQLDSISEDQIQDRKSIAELASSVKDLASLVTSKTKASGQEKSESK